MKTAILYESTHHGNTYQLVSAIAKNHEVTLIDVTQENHFNLEGYDLIGIASGVAFGNLYRKITSVVDTYLPAHKKVFFLYSCGKNSKDFSASLQEIIQKHNCQSLGSYGCKGYDTYGPFKLVGGINKNHPDANEIKEAIDFFETCLQKMKA